MKMLQNFGISVSLKSGMMLMSRQNPSKKKRTNMDKGSPHHFNIMKLLNRGLNLWQRNLKTMGLFEAYSKLFNDWQARRFIESLIKSLLIIQLYSWVVLQHLWDLSSMHRVKYKKLHCWINALRREETHTYHNSTQGEKLGCVSKNFPDVRSVKRNSGRHVFLMGEE